ncbi:DUF5994 family protein [Kitasatospora griseola]|uniref:DUF5994 family protein n=1 Tax=Kitasatospora griseola TaxID=2064 RepID=UPI00364E0EFF
MTATSDPTAAQPPEPEPPVRISLTPEGATRGRLDGAWWPRSHDLPRELPPLAAALDPTWGKITRVTVNPTHWPVIPRRVPVEGHVIHVGWFEQEQGADEVMVCSFIPLRLELLVIPPPPRGRDLCRRVADDGGVRPGQHPYPHRPSDSRRCADHRPTGRRMTTITSGRQHAVHRRPRPWLPPSAHCRPTVPRIVRAGARTPPRHVPPRGPMKPRSRRPRSR